MQNAVEYIIFQGVIDNLRFSMSFGKVSFSLSEGINYPVQACTVGVM